MSLEELKARQQQLVLQRSQAKDVVELTERELQTVGFAIQALEADEERRSKAPEVIED